MVYEHTFRNKAKLTNLDYPCIYDEALEYYKQNKVLSYTVNEDGSCEGIVAGSGDGNYHVHVDMEHPRKSTCDCPLANGKKIICKHIVAVSLCLDESEADRFKNEKTIYASEEEERRAKKYEKYMGFARTMSPRELREAYVELMTELDEYRLKEKYGNPHITSALPTSHCEAVTLLTRQKK